MRGLYFLLGVLFSACFALPPPPSIPSTFHAKVVAKLFSGNGHHQDSWSGSGLFALDVPKGFARTDLTMYGSKQPRMINIHTLDRYDMESSYFIENDKQKCTTTPVAGRLANPLKWVDTSSFVGEMEYLGQTLQSWEYKQGNVYHKVAVKKGTNEPVVFISNIFLNGSESELWMIVREWSAQPSPDWARYIPRACIDANSVGDVNGIVYFANNNWNCADVACDQTVPANTPQPDYACAEFVARSLAYGGYIPGLGATDPQSSYIDYTYNGNGYSLIGCTELSACLAALDWVKLPAAYSSVTAGVATFGDGGDGYFSHGVIGVGDQIIDAHNWAELQLGVSNDLFNGVDAAWGPPGTPPPSSSSYFSVQEEANLYKGGGFGGLNENNGEKLTMEKSGENNEFHLREEVPAQKFRL